MTESALDRLPEKQDAWEQRNQPRGWNIAVTAGRLRHYLMLARSSLKTLSGWFLAIRAYEHKYKLGYHLYEHSEHAGWLLERLTEMRGGKPEASVRPAFLHLLEETLHAPCDESFLKAYYGVLLSRAVEQLREDIRQLDQSGNANEWRILHRILGALEGECAWFESLGLSAGDDPWAQYIASLIDAAGGIHGDAKDPCQAKPRPHAGFFERPRTILFDRRVAIRPLMAYEERLRLAPREAAIEQFRVFFNEMYAAALLASVLFDAAGSGYPWGFYRDFSRHFWDEVRHSEFGCIRLGELGSEPDRCNPVLFDESEGLPILHRIAYLTRGLEAYFMPRKPKRFKEYEQSGDIRSQVFADQDWSDEINHVRYGSTWTDYLLEEDSREVDEVLEEVKAHLAKVRGKPVHTVDAPF